MAKKRSTITVPLEWTIEHEGEEITSFTLRRMKAGDTTVAEGVEDKMKASLLLLARLADVDVEVMEKLDIEDMPKLVEAQAALMGKSLAELVALAKEQEAGAPSSGAT